MGVFFVCLFVFPRLYSNSTQSLGWYFLHHFTTNVIGWFGSDDESHWEESCNAIENQTFELVIKK